MVAAICNGLKIITVIGYVFLQNPLLLSKPSFSEGHTQGVSEPNRPVED
jgi:hypothetical protein